MKYLVEKLQHWNFRVCGVFLIDAQFLIDASKFISGVMCALSAMVNLEITHVNVMTKLDLLNKQARKNLERFVNSLEIYFCLGFFYDLELINEISFK